MLPMQCKEFKVYAQCILEACGCVDESSLLQTSFLQTLADEWKAFYAKWLFYHYLEIWNFNNFYKFKNSKYQNIKKLHFFKN